MDINSKSAAMSKNIVGERVHHIRWGLGIITDIFEAYITVDFSGDAKRSVKFLFPNAFLGNDAFLSTSSDVLSSAINEISNVLYTCSICQAVSADVNELEGQRVCVECKRYAKKCSACEKYVDSRNKVFEKYRTCDDCFSQRYFSCSKCNKEHESRYWRASSNYIPDGEQWCVVCARLAGLTECEDGCRMYAPKDRFHKVGDDRHGWNNLCQDCLENDTYICGQCGETAYKKRKHFIDGYLCASCAREKQYLEGMKRIDFSSLRLEEISAYSLKRNSMGKTMTRLRCRKPSNADASVTIWGERKDYLDALLVTVSGEALVIISETDREVFPIEAIPVCNDYEKDYNTMTAFKRKERAYQLLWSKREILAEIDWSPDQVLSLWKTVDILCAQTDLDKDYRKEWRWGELEYEGNNYGDTSTFFIIGILKNKTSK